MISGVGKVDFGPFSLSVGTQPHNETAFNFCFDLQDWGQVDFGSFSLRVGMQPQNEIAFRDEFVTGEDVFS